MNELLKSTEPILEPPKELVELINVINAMFGPVGESQFILQDMFRIPAPPPKVHYDSQIKFSYYGNTGNSNGHNGIIIIASVVNNNVVHYGTAFCSPKDVYDKVKGKEIAYNDLCVNLHTVALRKKTHHEVNAGIFSNMIACGAYPSWAKPMVAMNTIIHIKKAMLPKL